MRFTTLFVAVSFALAAPVLAADPAAPASASSTKGGNDGETLALLCAINEHEIVAATVAEQKKVTGGVLDFAQMLEKEHGQNLVDTLALSTKNKMAPTETAAVQEQKKKGMEGLTALAQKDGGDFQKAFVEAMVKGHTEALQLLDQRLSSTSNEALKKHLTDTRQHVASHLEQAKKLQNDKAISNSTNPSSQSTTNSPTSTTK